MFSTSNRRHRLVATAFALLVGLTGLIATSASAAPRSASSARHAAPARRFQSRSAAGPSRTSRVQSSNVRPAGFGGGIDTTNDVQPTYDCHSDITNFGGSYSSQQILFGLNTVCGSNPNADANWTQGSVLIAWGIDLNGDQTDDYTVFYFNNGSSLVAEVDVPIGNGDYSKVCDAVPAWDGNNGFSATFSPSCIGSPAALSMLSYMQWDTPPFVGPDTCTCPFDVAPNGFAYVGPIVRTNLPLGDGPGVSSTATHQEDVFARGTDSALWTQHFDGTNWSGWSSLGGIITSAPVAASRAANIKDVFARGNDGALWHRHFNGTTWTNWNSLGGIITTAPAVVSSAPNTLDAFARGGDGALWTQHFDGTSWGGWSSLGGIINAEPGVASAAAGTIDTFVRGADNGLWTNHFDGTNWSGWTTLGGVLTSGPGATSASDQHLDVFVRGTDDALWVNRFNGTTWAGWVTLGGLMTSPAAAVSSAETTLDVFVRGTDNALWTNHFDGTDWLGWTSLNGIIM
jgi:hypothetical protein